MSPAQTRAKQATMHAKLRDGTYRDRGYDADEAQAFLNGYIKQSVQNMTGMGVPRGACMSDNDNY